MAGNNAVVIKRIKKGGHGGHHGGAWKVAYADFVTAMMAFFLLMWLINTTTPEQKRGIADYFAPASVSETTSGTGGILGGTALGDDGAKAKGTSSVIEELSPKSPNPDDGRKDFYTLTEKGLDLIPVLLNIVLWSAQHDAKSNVRFRKDLVARISQNPAQVSDEVKALVRNGGCMFPQGGR